MKKIMFNDKYGLTDAVLQGRKTMTRRMVNVPEYWHEMWVWGFAFDRHSHSLRLYDADEGPMEDPETGECAYISPKYKIGEVVAVAQSYSQLNKKGYLAPEWLDHTCEDSKGYSNKMFVRADLMPYQIRITDIKVERLQDISDEDCYEEGIMQSFEAFYYLRDQHFNTPKEAFADLIDKVSGKGTWETNPWVFAYSFELVK